MVNWNKLEDRRLKRFLHSVDGHTYHRYPSRRLRDPMSGNLSLFLQQQSLALHKRPSVAATPNTMKAKSPKPKNKT